MYVRTWVLCVGNVKSCECCGGKHYLFCTFFFITKIYINVLKGFVFFHFRLFFRFTMVAEISGFIY